MLLRLSKRHPVAFELDVVVLPLVRRLLRRCARMRIVCVTVPLVVGVMVRIVVRGRCPVRQPGDGLREGLGDALPHVMRMVILPLALLHNAGVFRLLHVKSAPVAILQGLVAVR